MAPLNITLQNTRLTGALRAYHKRLEEDNILVRKYAGIKHNNYIFLHVNLFVDIVHYAHSNSPNQAMPVGKFLYLSNFTYKT